MHDQPLPVLRARPSQLAERALVVGDPDRAASCAELLQDAEEVGRYREYRTFTGTYKGTRLSICSHGVGGSGASVAFHELFQGGVKTVIRAGTCGAMQPGIADGEIIIGTGAIRRDGTTPNLVPIEYPALANFEVVSALKVACTRSDINDALTGVVLTHANFYPGLIKEPMEMWIKAGVVAIEMEFATLLVMASIRGVRAGGLFVSDGNVAEDKSQMEMEDNAYDPHRDVVKQGTANMLRVALDALATL
jgi:uridine phosphorylase